MTHMPRARHVVFALAIVLVTAAARAGEMLPLDEVRPGGLGVHLIKSTMDQVEYRENAHGGTTLTLVKHTSAQKETS